MIMLAKFKCVNVKGTSRFAQCNLRVFCFMVFSWTIFCATPPLTISSIDSSYFQMVPGSSCYWNSYVEYVDWKYAARLLTTFNATKCANMCTQVGGCTGFEVRTTSDKLDLGFHLFFKFFEYYCFVNNF